VLNAQPVAAHRIPIAVLAMDITSGDAVWADDGSAAVRAGAAPREFYVEGKGPGDSPVNARWTQALGAGSYFEIEVKDLQPHSSCKVGVATEHGFAAGYRCKGLFFNGNLTNGSAGLKFGFGKTPSSGMVLGVKLELAEDKATVTFYQDGLCLGPGFVSKRMNPQAPIFPVVIAGSNGDRFSIRVLSEVPAAIRGEGSNGRSQEHPAIGDWELKSLMLGPELGHFPLSSKMEGQKVTCRVQPAEEKGEGFFSFIFKIGNTVRFGVQSSRDDRLHPLHALKPICPGSSTMMMPPPGMQEVEQKVIQSMESIYKWLAAEGQPMLLVGPTFEMSFEPSSGAEAGPITNIDLP